MNASPDLEETTGCLCLASRRAARAITRDFDRALRPHGLRATQFTLLSALSLAGAQTIGALAELIGVERTTMTRNVALARARGLVVVERTPGDDRVRSVRITEAGRAALPPALEAWRAVQARLTASMGGEVADALRALAPLARPSVARVRPIP